MHRGPYDTRAARVTGRIASMKLRMLVAKERSRGSRLMHEPVAWVQISVPRSGMGALAPILTQGENATTERAQTRLSEATTACGVAPPESHDLGGGGGQGRHCRVRNWIKSGCILIRLVGGGYQAAFGNSNICTIFQRLRIDWAARKSENVAQVWQRS